MQDSFLTLGILSVLIFTLGMIILFIKRYTRLHAQHLQVLLFDKRLALYQAAQTLIEGLLLQKTLPEDAFSTFKKASTSAPFLLDDSLARDLKELPQCALSIQKLNSELTPVLSTNERLMIASRLTAENTWISTLAESLEGRFARYLKV